MTSVKVLSQAWEWVFLEVWWVTTGFSEESDRGRVSMEDGRVCISNAGSDVYLSALLRITFSALRKQWRAIFYITGEFGPQQPGHPRACDREFALWASPR
jgi:hypothetical protein